jgi:hypothetical protein
LIHCSKLNGTRSAWSRLVLWQGCHGLVATQHWHLRQAVVFNRTNIWQGCCSGDLHLFSILLSHLVAVGFLFGQSLVNLLCDDPEYGLIGLADAIAAQTAVRTRNPVEEKKDVEENASNEE